MQAERSLRSLPTIFWPSVIAVVAVYISFTLSWITYRVHLPNLLKQAEFPATFAPQLLLLEVILAIGLEPLMGGLSDRVQRQRGTRFLVINTGVGLACLLFVAIPSLAAIASIEAGNQWLLPVALVSWAIAMSIFRSPLIALLHYYASEHYRVIAASLLTVVIGLAGVLTPVITPLINRSGITLTFLGCALLLLAAVVTLRSFVSLDELTSYHHDNHVYKSNVSHILTTFGLGLTLTMTLRLILDRYPAIFNAHISDLPPTFVTSLFFLAMAIAAIPIAMWATRWNQTRVMWLGLGGLLASLGWMLTTHTTWAIAVAALLAGIGFSIAFTEALAIALSPQQTQWVGLSVGAFWGGGAAASSIASAFQSVPLSAAAGFGAAAIALLVAGLCAIQLKQC